MVLFTPRTPAPPLAMAGVALAVKKPLAVVLVYPGSGCGGRRGGTTTGPVGLTTRAGAVGRDLGDRHGVGVRQGNATS